MRRITSGRVILVRVDLIIIMNAKPAITIVKMITGGRAGMRITADIAGMTEASVMIMIRTSIGRLKNKIYEGALFHNSSPDSYMVNKLDDLCNRNAHPADGDHCTGQCDVEPH